MASRNVVPALKAMDALVREAQALLANNLEPEGPSDRDTLLALVSLLDGPVQRQAQGLVASALAELGEA